MKALVLEVLLVLDPGLGGDPTPGGFTVVPLGNPGPEGGPGTGSSSSSGVGPVVLHLVSLVPVVSKLKGLQTFMISMVTRRDEASNPTEMI